MSDELSQKTARAFKWSSITELIAKLVAPCINMILARILAPDDFGMLATVTMVISFAEIFVESGFQKFLIQHEFVDSKEENRYLSVAFWSNLAISMLLFSGLVVFSQEIAILVGNEGSGLPIAVSAIAVPLYGIVGIQNSILKKRLEFKKLFFVRIFSAFTPLIVTLPLALLGMGYWSLIIGNLASIIVQILILLVVGKYLPTKHFDFYELKFMLGFGAWTLLDGLLVWATNWIDSLLISSNLNDYYLGLYKNTSGTIISIFSIVTAAIAPVMFSSLSKLQYDNSKFKELFLKTQHYLCVFLLPIGVGLFVYRGFATQIMFGSQWTEAADIVGVMALSTVLRTIFVSFYSDLYRAKGRFIIPLVLQVIDVCVLIPLCIFSLQEGFWDFIYVRGVSKLLLIIPELVCAWIFCKLSPRETYCAVWRPFFATILMGCVAILLSFVGSSVSWTLLSIFICALFYFTILLCFKQERLMLLSPLKSFLNPRKNFTNL